MITEDCTVCDACVEPCPNEAISEGDDIYVIDALRCTECIGTDEEPQCITVCPSACILPNPDFEESVDELQEKFDFIHG